MLEECRGGCRGRGLFVQGSLAAGDPGCGGISEIQQKKGA